MARVYVRGECIGIGASCNRHVDHPPAQTRQKCQKQMIFGGNSRLSEDECVRRLKEWLLQGLYIERLAVGGRLRHVSMHARGSTRPPKPEAELDQLLQVQLAEMNRTGMQI